MFINCKYCNALVATDPATDLPPERCPRCAGVLRGPATAAAATPPEAAPAVAAPTLSSLLVPPAAPGQPVTPEAMAPVADIAEGPVEAIAEPEAVAPASTEEPAPPPAPASPVDLPAADRIEASNAVTVADADGIDPPPPVGAPPTVEVADAIETIVPVQVNAPKPGETASDAEPAASATDAGPASMTAPAPTPDDASDAVDTPAAPSFLPARPRASNAAASRRWLAPAIAAALALLLGLQVLLADRARLAADAQWRPWVVSLCNAFGCDVPAWREPAAFTLLAREVRPHPQAAGALRVDATFRNDARWPQAWPRLLLTLSDVEGRPVAARAFAPGEYLAEPANAATLDSGGSARIRIDLREPTAATVSYSFDFR